MFEKSDFYKKYFNWYTEGISKSEVKEIYSKIGIDFHDIKWIKNDDSKSKILKK